MLRIKLTLLTLIIGACATVSNSDVILLDSKPINAKSGNILENQLKETPIDIWERIRRELTIKIPDDQIAATSIYRERLYKNQSAVNRISKSGQRYLFHTLSRAQELDLPVELALLPFVESEFDPYAKSVDGATGIWQFMPATGKEWGLKSNWWYDGKKDVLASTEAALKFLSYLHQKFDEDWLLAMAAYNTGPARVNRAIKKNKTQDKGIRFWDLDLPKETTAYVPKLLVLCELISNPKSFEVNLPSIANRPYFQRVKIPGQLDLMQAADLAGLKPETIYELNPGFNQWATDPSGPHYLLLPIGVSDRFITQLESLDENDLVRWDRYKIRRGDSLSRIASRYKIEVAVLKEINGMNDDLIIAGKEIMVPRGSAWANKQSPREQLYIVLKGDTLWNISRKFKVSIEDLVLWNELNLEKPLQINQEIKIFSRYERIRQDLPSRELRTMLYPVKSGDTISRIASKFEISPQKIQEWNEIEDVSKIFPGQVLKLFL
ncbi:MAG: LysM peptidoglycan-binding domain-containing protein [Pseudomonadota bacterium]|nr:LysM peptidoglycan-binding domain-containing protein [Pseudomonadota bacterium]